MKPMFMNKEKAEALPVKSINICGDINMIAYELEGEHLKIGDWFYATYGDLEFEAVPLSKKLGMPRIPREPFVVTTTDARFGAAAIMSNQATELLFEEFGDILIILPSPVHEILVMADDGQDVNKLAEMVKTINSTEVSAQDRLSDHVFRLTRGKGLEVAA